VGLVRQWAKTEENGKKVNIKVSGEKCVYGRRSLGKSVRVLSPEEKVYAVY